MLVESLENRRLMSVSVHQLPNGGLLVKGTEGNDHVGIDQTGSTVTVNDLDTTVGQPTVATGVRYLVVDFGNGDDAVFFSGSDSNAAILTGNGSDHVEVTALGTENVVIDTGNRDDSMSISAFGDSNVVAFAGNGDDTADILVLDNAHVVYDAGPGNDSAFILNFGDSGQCQVIYNGGSGYDTAFLNGTPVVTINVENVMP